MNLISDEVLETIEKSIEKEDLLMKDINLTFTKFKSFMRYIIFKYYSFNFEFLTPVKLFYNKYYWFLKFKEESKTEIGYDAGIEQIETDL